MKEKTKNILRTTGITFIFTVIGIWASWHSARLFSKVEFTKWQEKVAQSTAANIELEKKVCDRILKYISVKKGEVKVISSNEATTTSSCLDIIQEQAIILKDIVGNSLHNWGIMFPDLSQKYFKEIETVNKNDKKLIAITTKIKTLEEEVKSKKTETSKLQAKVAELAQLTKSYKETLDFYKDMPAIYTSSITTSDSIASGTLVLSDGTVFNPSTSNIDISKVNFTLDPTLTEGDLIFKPTLPEGDFTLDLTLTEDNLMIDHTLPKDKNEIKRGD